MTPLEILEYRSGLSPTAFGRWSTIKAARIRSLPTSTLVKNLHAYLNDPYHFPEPGVSNSLHSVFPALDLLIDELISVVTRSDSFENPGLSIFESAGYKAASLLSILRDESGLVAIRGRLDSLEGRDKNLLEEKILSCFRDQHSDLWRKKLFKLGAIGEDDSLFEASTIRRYLPVDDRLFDKDIKEFSVRWALEQIQTEHSNGGQFCIAVHILSVLRQEKLYQCLASAHVKDPDFRHIGILLSLSSQIGLHFGEPFLEKVIENADRGKYRTKGIRSTAIELLVKERHPSGLAYLDSVLQKPEEHQQHIVEQAWCARFHYEGLQETGYCEGKVIPEIGPKDLEHLPLEVQIYCLTQSVVFVSRIGFEGLLTDPLAAEPARLSWALQSIGCRKHAGVIRKLFAAYGDGPLGSEEAINLYIDSLPERKRRELAKLSEKFRDLDFNQSVTISFLEWDYKRQKKQKI